MQGRGRCLWTMVRRPGLTPSVSRPANSGTERGSAAIAAASHNRRINHVKSHSRNSRVGL